MLTENLTEVSEIFLPSFESLTDPCDAKHKFTFFFIIICGSEHHAL